MRLVFQCTTKHCNVLIVLRSPGAYIHNCFRLVEWRQVHTAELPVRCPCRCSLSLSLIVDAYSKRRRISTVMLPTECNIVSCACSLKHAIFWQVRHDWA